MEMKGYSTFLKASGLEAKLPDNLDNLFWTLVGAGEGGLTPSAEMQLAYSISP